MITSSGYNHNILELGRGNTNPDSDLHQVVLVSGYTFNAGHTNFNTQIASTEIAGGNGYTTGGQVLTNITWTYDSGENRTTFDADDTTWNATGGNIGPTSGAIVKCGNIPLFYVDFDGPKTATEGGEFKLRWATLGLYYFNQ